MCLAIPGKLIEIATDPNGVRMGKANFGGIAKQVCLEYTPEAQAGDYVLVHVGFALSKVNEEEAARTYKLLEEMKQLGELDTPDLDAVPFAEHLFSPSPSSPSLGRAARRATSERDNDATQAKSSTR
jgi:hydrogenase expression/formation protein HypC